MEIPEDGGIAGTDRYGIAWKTAKFTPQVVHRPKSAKKQPKFCAQPVPNKQTGFSTTLSTTCGNQWHGLSPKFLDHFLDLHLKGVIFSAFFVDCLDGGHDRGMVAGENFADLGE